MPRLELDLNPVSHISADAIGAPGQRIFYIQGWQESDPQPVTIIIEKIQLQSLAVGIEQFQAEIAKQNPNLPQASADYLEPQMHISPPVDPLFRVGEIGMGYDRDNDLVVLLMREIVLEGADPENAAVVRFWCTRSQARAMARWGAEVASRGRPLCPQCGGPMEPEGHFCPKKNGHKKQ
ncbi:MAG: DUF3090 domain-containing protein [Anaerolineales bacterium]|jgi:uncharacterized repeat protein (TIGR03847 family)|nr:DUF3090 domain-containing protein [Anaerolineales bacterium]